MSIKRNLLIGGILALATGLIQLGCDKSPTGAAASKHGVDPLAWFRSAPIKQPVEFNHKIHIDSEQMECTDCHRYANKASHATLPKIADCKDCHSQPQGKSPEEAKVKQYLKEGKEIPWIVVNRLPGHVYFSHQAHVNYAEMKCWDCHTDMRKETHPIARSDISYLSMGKCMECHKEKGVGLDCLKCHK